jgi:hypothetical protein
MAGLDPAISATPRQIAGSSPAMMIVGMISISLLQPYSVLTVVPARPDLSAASKACHGRVAHLTRTG